LSLFTAAEKANIVENSRLRSSDRTGFALVFVQLGLLTLFAWYYGIQEGQGFPLLMMITLPAFLIHAFLPLKSKPYLLLAIFIATCLGTLGWVTGGCILFVSACIVVIAGLKFRLWIRLFLIAIIVAGMIVLRNGWFFAPRAIIAVPYIATLFIFRLISYFYHEKHGFGTRSLITRISYFLMLPNLVFLLFPIIDYRTFVESQFQKPAIEIYKKGIIRIGTGIVLLMIHRLLYFYCAMDPMTVNTLTDFLTFALISYLLIIQVVGIFMVSIGWVTLFGYNLPPIFENFFFATGFSNLWRRINHYWRDFIIKVFYFPLFFRLRKKGQVFAMLVAGLIGFFCSWMLHSVQLYWITGHFTFSATDGVYWMTMGICITLDGIYQYKNLGKKKTRGTIAGIVVSGLRITGMFLFATLLWTIWNSDSISAWTYLIGASMNSSAADLIKTTGAILSFIVVSGVLIHFFRPPTIKTYWYEKKLVPVAFGIFFSLLILFKYVASDLPAGSMYANIEQNIGKAKVNDADREMVDLGYYDQLVDMGGIGRTGTQFRLFGDIEWGEGHGATHATGDVMLRMFNPNAHAIHRGIQFDISSLGIRDKEYGPKPDSGVYRWVFLGGSYILGPGVEKENTFEALTEKYLDDSLQKSGSGVEILNYAMGGWMLTQQVALCKGKAFESSPHAVFYFCHPDEADYTIKNLSRLTSYGISLKEFPFLDSIAAVAGLQQSQSRLEMFHRLQPFKDAIVHWGYREIVNACRSHNATPVWVFLPTTTDQDTDEKFTKWSSEAKQAGFVTLNLSNVYSGHKADEIQIGEPDTHPNTLGNFLISRNLISEIRKNNLFLPTD
jgi:hypothetical protein